MYGENQGFLRTDHGLLWTPDLVYFCFELVSYSFQRDSVKYMNSGKNSRLWIPIQIFKFPAVLPWLPLPIMQLWAWTPLLRLENEITPLWAALFDQYWEKIYNHFDFLSVRCKHVIHESTKLSKFSSIQSLESTFCLLLTNPPITML